MGRDCGRQVELDPGEMAERYGAETTVIDWHARLTCSGCGSRQVDFVVTGSERRQIESVAAPDCRNRSLGTLSAIARLPRGSPEDEPAAIT
jgi:hypothetical protein